MFDIVFIMKTLFNTLIAFKTVFGFDFVQINRILIVLQTWTLRDFFYITVLEAIEMPFKRRSIQLEKKVAESLNWFRLQSMINVNDVVNRR